MFFSTGSQYYIIGRYAAFAWLNPVVGNLLHHAVEFFLKGALSKNMSLKELQQLRHHLKPLWEEFKTQFNDPALNQYDPVISSLHAFEEIRYPDSILAKGMQSTIDIVKSSLTGASGTPTNGVPHYKLCLQEIDKLVGAIFIAASRNPKAYFLGFNTHATTYLNKDNTVAHLMT